MTVAKESRRAGLCTRPGRSAPFKSSHPHCGQLLTTQSVERPCACNERVLKKGLRRNSRGDGASLVFLYPLVTVKTRG